MKKIVLTGGGTAGHINPNIALIPFLKEKGYEIIYIGSKDGIEKQLIKDLKENIKYYEISSGKLRRYLDFKNITDSFNVIKGIYEAKKIIKEISPNIIFSKGGFVSVPVVLGGYFNKVPVIIHESDISSGLANKIAIPFAKKVCATFPELYKNLPKDKRILTGTPIRRELFNGNRELAKKMINFKNDKPILLFMGGSLGSLKINSILRKALPNILKNYNVIHLCGKNNIDISLKNLDGYFQIEYAKEELKDILAYSDIIISRAGANAIFEILSIKKPNILIPLSKNASRGDQILNAKSFKEQGFSEIIFEENLTEDELISKINYVFEQKNKFIEIMNKFNKKDSISIIIDEIEKISLD